MGESQSSGDEGERSPPRRSEDHSKVPTIKVWTVVKAGLGFAELALRANHHDGPALVMRGLVVVGDLAAAALAKMRRC